MSTDRTVKRKRGSDVIFLRDLAPRTTVVGGGGKLRLGERREPVADSEPRPHRRKERSRKTDSV